MTANQMLNHRKYHPAFVASLLCVLAIGWSQTSLAQIIDPAARNRTPSKPVTTPVVLPQRVVPRVAPTKVVNPPSARPYSSFDYGSAYNSEPRPTESRDTQTAPTRVLPRAPQRPATQAAPGTSPQKPAVRNRNTVRTLPNRGVNAPFLAPAAHFIEDFGPRINPGNELTPLSEFTNVGSPAKLFPEAVLPKVVLPRVIPRAAAPPPASVSNVVAEPVPAPVEVIADEYVPAPRIQSSLTMPIATDAEPQSIYAPEESPIVVLSGNDDGSALAESILTESIPPIAAPPPMRRPVVVNISDESHQPYPESSLPLVVPVAAAQSIVEPATGAPEYSDTAPSILPSISDWTEPEQIQSTVKTIAFLAIVSLAPAVLLMTTSFVRISVVLSLLRQALGTQMLPSNQMVTSLSMFLSLLVMLPTWKQVYDDSIMPYSSSEIEMTAEQAWVAGVAPVRKFMSDQIDRAGNAEDVMLFYQYLPDTDGTPQTPQYYEDVPLHVLLPAFMVSELKTAFLIGFQIFIPFLILDLVVSSLTVSTGMMMLPPATISLPLKLILFVLVDGWHLVAGMLLQSFGAG